MKKSSGPRLLAEFVPQCVGPAARERGFAAAELIARWTEVAGPQIGPHSRPLRFAWPPRGQASDLSRTDTDAAVLHIKVEGAFALALHYESAALIGRINAYLGWRCVSAIRIKQGPVRPTGIAEPDPPQLPQAVRQRLSAALETVPPELAEPLRRLGEAVLAKKARGGATD